MAPIGTVYGPPWHTYIQLLNAVANYAGVELTNTPSFEHFKDNLAPEYLAKFPMGKVPAFEGADGYLLTESTAIQRYVAAQGARHELLGATPQEEALITQWVSFVELELHMRNSTIFQLLRGLFGMKPYNKGLHTFQAARQAEALAVLDAHLARHTFLVGERVTLADIRLAGTMNWMVQTTLDAQERALYPAVIRHLETVVYQPMIKGALGQIKYAEKALTYQPPQKEKKAE